MLQAHTANKLAQLSNSISHFRWTRVSHQLNHLLVVYLKISEASENAYYEIVVITGDFNYTVFRRKEIMKKQLCG